MWTESLDDDKKLVRILVSTGGTEAVIDEFDKRFKWLEDYRVVLMPAEATLPRPAEDPPETASRKSDPERIAREELYANVGASAKLSSVFLSMVALSTIVAAVGLLRDSPVIVLSAMVIAPLLGPNVALALATTLGDRQLGRTAMKSGTAGFLLALGLAVFIGLAFPVDPASGEIASRSVVDLGDIVLALAAGAAGALSITAGASSALIGVMVAVALLPPTVVTGLHLGCGNFGKAAIAAELVAINLLCLVLAAILTFIARGIRPATWWEAEKAKRATRRAVIAGGLLLAALAALIVVQAL
jgi:uncharacterized hydrophobic protein (TIGR00341 family)